MIFPGIQGGPLMHVIAAKAICFWEALQPSFKVYQNQVVNNARIMAKRLQSQGYDIISGGTDNHLMLVSLVKQSLTGKAIEAALGQANITVNKNAVPNDPASPFVTSGIRLGTPAITSRGFVEADVEIVADCVMNVLQNHENEKVLSEVRHTVKALCARHPVYKDHA